jgi:hypothetical protein
MNTFSSTDLYFSPLLPLPWLMAACGALVILGGTSLFQTRGRAWPRVLCAAAFMAALFGPSLIREERKPVKDVAAIVVDQSASQNFSKRKQTTQNMLEHLKSTIQKFSDIDLRVVDASDKGESETKLFDALDRALADVPAARRAGVILLTDGQVHDAPKDFKTAAHSYGPIHTILTGNKNDRDRRLKIIDAPSYGITGTYVTIKYEIEDSGFTGSPDAVVTVNGGTDNVQTFSVPPGSEQTVTLPITHAGQNIFQISTDALPGELTAANNRAAIIVNGVRDRLRVLLVSGQPYAGARIWRDLLTSDPAVDLVHFTILRDPEKIDPTPSNELSLIAFPIDELFQQKLDKFDLIIFDRYKFSNILTDIYFKNIARYVRDGGALLVATGPEYPLPGSIYSTALGDVLPASPGGDMIQKSFIPTITDTGKNHPVTRGMDIDQKNFGPWLRQNDLLLKHGETLMNGVAGKPLLILNRVDQGRVAMIASDQIWLWARGYNGGGPHAGLLRRLAHWLMKEPELEEKGLDITVSGNAITIHDRNTTATESKITMTKPDDQTETITLDPDKNGGFSKTITANDLGVYGFENRDGNIKFALVGPANPPELSNVVTTPDILKPLADASGGGIIWAADTPRPDIKMLGKNARYTGANWLGLRANNDFTVEGARQDAILPPWALAAILAALSIFAWWREGKSN